VGTLYDCGSAQVFWNQALVKPRSSAATEVSAIGASRNFGALTKGLERFTTRSPERSPRFGHFCVGATGVGVAGFCAGAAG
jgi:hypothetical protein